VLTQLSRDSTLAADDLAVLVAASEALFAVGLLELLPEDLDPSAPEILLEANEVEGLLGEREEARHRGDFATADGIRDRLNQMGIEIRDTPEGTVWTARPAPAGPSREDLP
jgi:cysteinyl-tRNA synthetase